MTVNERIERVTMSVEEAAQELGLCTKVVYELAHREDFPAFRWGRRVRINREGLRLWVNARTQGMMGKI